MKKSILILLIMISCIGCTSEGPHDGCDSGSLNLIFTHEGTTDDFDLSVASDIELYLYDNEGRIIEERHIPYDNIKGGRPYRETKISIKFHLHFKMKKTIRQ